MDFGGIGQSEVFVEVFEARWTGVISLSTLCLPFFSVVYSSCSGFGTWLYWFYCCFTSTGAPATGLLVVKYLWHSYLRLVG